MGESDRPRMYGTVCPFLGKESGPSGQGAEVSSWVSCIRTATIRAESPGNCSGAHCQARCRSRPGIR